MRRLNLFLKISMLGLSAILGCFGSQLSGQETKEPEPVKKYVTLRYFNINNSDQYLLLSAIMKTPEGVMPQKNISFSVYMDDQDDEHLVGKNATDAQGLAKFFLPPSLKSLWDSSAKHTFTAVANAGTDEEQTQEVEMQKGRIAIDTSNTDGVRSITVQVSKLEDGAWLPVPDVEMKVGVRRLAGVVLSGGDDPTYTSDESGNVSVEFTKLNLPGDSLGNLTLEAKVEDNDPLGNMIVEKTVPWGIKETVQRNFFDQRTLWSTRFKTPIWLLLLAYSIVLSVWGTLLYLVYQLIKIKRLGRKTAPDLS